MFQLFCSVNIYKNNEWKVSHVLHIEKIGIQFNIYAIHCTYKPRETKKAIVETQYFERVVLHETFMPRYLAWVLIDFDLTCVSLHYRSWDYTGPE